MKKIQGIFLLAAASVAAASLSARDLEPFCWFYADFDTPTRIAGGAFPQTPDDCGYRDAGRYGRAYYFHAKAENALPPMASFLTDAANFAVDAGSVLATGETLALEGGMTVAPRHVEVSNSRPWTSLTMGYTCSFYARGAVGTSVSATVVLTPLTDLEIATISNNCTGANNWRTFASAPFNADQAETETFAMTGGWRRVQCHAVFDNRAKFVGRTVALRVVTSGGAVELARFQYHQTGEYPRLKNYRASVWVDGGATAEPSVLSTSDPVYVKSFPCAEGSFSCWVKCPVEDDDSNHTFPTWGLARSWSSNWGFNGSTFSTGSGSARSVPCYDTAFTMPRAWRHYAGTWKDGEMRVYIDGVLLEKRVKTGVSFEDMALTGSPTFRCGTRQDGDTAADALLDDVAIFSTALTADEVAAIAHSDTALFAGSTVVLAEPVAFTHFYRNQTNAAIRTRLTLSAADRLTVRSSVADEALPPFDVSLPAGDSWFAVPFNPSRLRSGDHAWSFTLEDAAGKVRLARSGTLTVRDRRERSDWRVLSWGGSKSISHDFLKTCGIDGVNCTSKSMAESAVKSGLQVNVNYTNWTKIKDYDFDYAALAAEATNDFAYAQGLHDWTSTLLNTEVYNAGTAWKYTNSPKFIATARAEIGCEPDWTFADGMNGLGVSYGRLGEKVPAGIVDGSHRTYRTLLWYMDVGMPQYRLNWATADALHRLCPDNVAWSEPVMMPGGMANGLDMVADWFYEYDPNSTLADIRRCGGQMRALGRAFMPTLAFGYWSNVTGYNPETPGTTTKTTLGQSEDELEIKSWMCLGAVRSDHFSIFSADCWEWGLTGAVTHAAEPTKAVTQICDPDAPAKFGAFMRDRLRPAATLLRGIENERAPVAFVLTGEGYYAGGFGWYGYHYEHAFTKYLSQYGVPYDQIHDHEINAETLAKYPYIIFPLSKLVTEEHDAAFRAAAEQGSTIVLDSYATFTYTNAVQLSKLNANYGNGTYVNNLKTPFFSWYSNVSENVKAYLPAWSDHDFDGEPGSYTFCKERGGARYVTVVNNARRTGGGILTDFKTSSTYKPYGAAQRITTHLKVPTGGCVYLFNGLSTASSTVDAASSPRPSESGLLFERRGGDAASTGQGTDEWFVHESDYAAGEGRVFVVAPRPYAAVDIDVDGTGGALAPGGVGSARVVVRDADGKAAAGRQVVRVTVTAPNGVARDESGDYVVEGSLRFALRFARGEELGTTARPWRLVVRELASGLVATNAFTLKGPACVNTVANYVKPGLVSFWDSEFGEVQRLARSASPTDVADRYEVDGELKAERVYDRALNAVELAHNRAIDDFRYRERTARVTRNAASYVKLELGDAEEIPLLQTWTPAGVTPALDTLVTRAETEVAPFSVPEDALVVAISNGVRCAYAGVALTEIADDGTETTRSYDASVTSVKGSVSNDCFAVWQWHLQRALAVEVEGQGAVSLGGNTATDGTLWFDATGGTFQVTATPNPGWRFVRWGGDVAEAAASEPTLTLPANAPKALKAVFEESPIVPAVVGEYVSYDLVKDLGVVIDADYAAGDTVTVKIEGLVKGLTLTATQQKELVSKNKYVVTNVVYTLAGVPAATVDYETQPMFARVVVTRADKTKVETLERVRLQVEASTVAKLPDGVLGTDYAALLSDVWPEVTTAWTVKGLPSGLKYTSKLVTVKNTKTKTVTTNALPFTVYGKPTKAGTYTVTATCVRQVGTKRQTETRTATLTVWPSAAVSSYRYEDQAYVPLESTRKLPLAASVSGLPTGVKFNAKTKTLYGTPTKLGVFAVTVTQTDKTKDSFLWKVTPGENEGVLKFASWDVSDATVRTMQGAASANWTVAVPSGAKVTVSGLPRGLAFTQNKTTGVWTFSGAPTAAGSYTVTFTTVRNGVTVVERITIEVEANACAGTWQACQDEEYDGANVIATVTVAAGGSVSLALTEATQGTTVKSTATAKTLDASGNTVTLSWLRNRRDAASTRTCVLDFANGTVTLDGVRVAGLHRRATATEAKDVTTFVLEKVTGAETNFYAYLTATHDAKKSVFTVAGKLADGTAVKASTYALEKPTPAFGRILAPFLVTDKVKNAVYLELSDDGSWSRVLESGVAVEGIALGSAAFAASELKVKKVVGKRTSYVTATVADLAPAALLLRMSAPGCGELVTDANSSATVAASGLTKFTYADDLGGTWTIETLPVNAGDDLQFHGLATRKCKVKSGRKTVTETSQGRAWTTQE